MSFEYFQIRTTHYITETSASLLTRRSRDHRDGKEALRIALEITNGEGSERPDFLDTLAAAQAEVGDFASAVITAKRALSFADADDAATTANLEDHLSQFEAKRPVREH